MNAPSFLNCRGGCDGESRPGEITDATRAQSSAIEELRRWEAGAILRRRHIAGVSNDPLPPANTSAPPPDDLIGLALSGGGVRSAAFNLGFLQALSEADLLRYVDYLCSVSGGGYIAGHLSALASPSQRNGDSEPASPFHGSQAAQLGLDARQKLNSRCYRFRHMGDYLTDYVGIIWRYVLYTIPLLFWATCLMGIFAAAIALVWRLCDLAIARQYFELIGLDRLGYALHVGDETPMAFLPSGACFVGLLAMALLRWARPASHRWKTAVRVAVVLWLMSLGISLAVFLGNGESSLGASDTNQSIQSYVTSPLLIITVVSFLPLLFAGQKLMQSGREHAPRWKKLVFHVAIGGATISAAFLMVHLMARENLSGFASHRNPLLLPGDVYDWNAFLALFDAPGEGPLAAAMRGRLPADRYADFLAALGEVRTKNLELRQQREQIVGRDTWEQWEGVPFIHLYAGTWRLAAMHLPGERNVFRHLRQWSEVRSLEQRLLDDFINPVLTGAMQVAARSGDAPRERETLTNELFQILVLRADEQRDEPTRSPAAQGGEPSASEIAARQASATAGELAVAPDRFDLDERRNLEEHLDKRAKDMIEGSTFLQLANRYLLHLTRTSLDPGGSGPVAPLTSAERTQLNRLALECLFPEIIRERTMVSTYIVPPMDQWYRVCWLGFWIAGFLLFGLIDMNRLSPFYTYYRDRLDEYFVQSAPQAERETTTPIPPPRTPGWDALKNLRPWERGAPYPLMLGSAFFLNKVGVVQSPASGSAAGDAFKQHSFLFSPLYCGTAATGYQRTDLYCDGNLRLCEAMAMSGAALTPFMIDNVWFAGLMAAFNFRIGQWLPRPAKTDYDAKSPRCSARPLSLLAELGRAADAATYSDTWQMALVADGGFHDFFGLEELLLRRCKLIIVSDAGCNNDQYEFGALADVIRLARERHGIDIVDLDDDQAADLCGMRRIVGENRQQLYHTCLRILYPPQGDEREPRVGLLVYAQMSLTGREQIDLQQFRKVHPNFPDEPITNQFFSHGQIESYRQLGFHIGGVVCREIRAKPDAEGNRPDRQQIEDDLVLGYLQEYHCHVRCAEVDTMRPENAPQAVSDDDATQRSSRNVERRDRTSELHQATCLLEARRSHWFREGSRQRRDPVFQYERNPAVRQNALSRVRNLLSQPWDSSAAGGELTTAEVAHLFLACHERNAGLVASRFLAGGREILLRRLPSITALLAVPTLHDDPQSIAVRMHRRPAGPLLMELATGVLQSRGEEATADFAICVMRSYGMLHIDQSGKHSSLAEHRRAIVTALRRGDVERISALVAGWDLPQPAAVPEQVV